MPKNETRSHLARSYKDTLSPVCNEYLDMDKDGFRALLWVMERGIDHTIYIDTLLFTNSQPPILIRNQTMVYLPPCTG
jgi:hypothetical protein